MKSNLRLTKGSAERKGVPRLGRAVAGGGGRDAEVGGRLEGGFPRGVRETPFRSRAFWKSVFTRGASRCGHPASSNESYRRNRSLPRKERSMFLLVYAKEVREDSCPKMKGKDSQGRSGVFTT